jgi:hypothetical protein
MVVAERRRRPKKKATTPISQLGNLMTWVRIMRRRSTA